MFLVYPGLPGKLSERRDYSLVERGERDLEPSKYNRG